jgi:hypothetical protein
MSFESPISPADILGLIAALLLIHDNIDTDTTSEHRILYMYQ